MNLSGSQAKCNEGSSPNPWNFISAVLAQYGSSGSACLGAMLNESASDPSGRPLVPCTWELLCQDNPNLCIRDLLPRNTILHISGLEVLEL